MIDERIRDATPTRTWAGESAPSGALPTFPERWRLDRLVGSGGQADVWLARDLELGEWVAIKVFRGGMSLAARERLRREVRLGRALQHSRLVRVFELLELGGRLAVVMEWVPGGNLAGRIARERLEIDEVVRAAEETLEVLAYIHEQGVVHRDVKPSNLLLDERGGVRLVDLGLARRVEDQGDLTRTAMAVGTPSYMSPEQLRGQRAVPASDLYALGVTLYQMLVGRMPFEAESEYELAQLHLKEKPRDVQTDRPDCPRWLARFVGRLLEKRPEDRFKDGGRALEALAGKRVGVSPQGVRRILASLGAGALLVLIGWGATLVQAHLASGPAVRVEISGRAIEGVDARGRAIWRSEMQWPVQQVERADLDGDDVPEVIAVAYRTTTDRSPQAARSEVMVVDRQGHVMTRFCPEDQIVGWPVGYPLEVRPTAELLDLDDDGTPEVVLRCPQAEFYPFALFVFWPRQGVWDRVLVHSGWLTDFERVPGTSPVHLRFCGVNNVVGMSPVVGEIELSPPTRGVRRGQGFPLSVGDGGDPNESESRFARWLWYTLLPEAGQPLRLRIERDLGTTVVSRGLETRVDALGNPVDGPNAGIDLRRQRLEFLREIASLSAASQPFTVADVSARYDELARRFPRLLLETPYRDALETRVALATARAGDLERATALLRETLKHAPSDDVAFNLAELEALTGRLDEASALIRRILAAPVTDRANYDAAQLLFDIAIETREPRDIEMVLRRIAGQSAGAPTTTGVAAALLARAHLWWDEVTSADCSVRSWAYAPAGEAIACLARWRLGRTVAGDVAAMRRFGSANPDATMEGRLALAAAQLGAGRPRDAAATIGAVLPVLEAVSRDSFTNRQLLDLARALSVKALAESGESAAALREARRIRPELRDGLLPAHVVDETVNRAHASATGTVGGRN